MFSYLRCVRGLLHDQRGGTAIEYGLILALVVIAIIASIALLGKTTSDIWNGVMANVIAHGPRG